MRAGSCCPGVPRASAIRSLPWGAITFGLCVVAGLLLRGYFLAKPGFDDDLNWQLHWGKRVYNQGLWELYRGDFTNRERPKKFDIADYPPAVPLLASAAVRAHPRNFQERKDWYRRVGTIVEIVVLGGLIALILRSGGRHRWLAVSLTAFNPGLIFATSSWGQVDCLLAAVLVVGFFGAASRRFSWLGTAILVGPLIKPQGALFVPIYLAVLLARRKWSVLRWHVFAGALILGVTIATFRILAGSNFMDIYTKAVGAFSSLSWTAANAWWAVFGGDARSIADERLLLGISCRMWGLFGFASVSVFGWALFLRSPRRLADIWLFAAWVALAFFLFPTQMHERYLYYAVLLSLVPAAYSSGLLVLSGVLSFMLYLNSAKVFAFYYPKHLPSWLTRGSQDLELQILSWGIVAVGLCYFIAAVRFFRREAGMVHESGRQREELCETLA